MKNFINEFYYGNITAQPRHFQDSMEYQETVKSMCDSEELLNHQLEGENKELFLAYVKACDELAGLSTVDTFADGFRLGAAFALDTFSDADELYYT